MDSGRRGSGVSITLPRPQGHGGPNGMDKSFGLNYPPMPGYSTTPYFVQSPPYPMLMNPPHMPTVRQSHFLTLITTILCANIAVIADA